MDGYPVVLLRLRQNELGDLLAWYERGTGRLERPGFERPGFEPASKCHCEWFDKESKDVHFIPAARFLSS